MSSAEKKTARPYRKLTNKASSLGAFSRLWLGPDHLLQVTGTGYTESYRRYFFRDIQAISLQKTNRRAIWALVWIILALLSGLIVAQLSSTWIGLGIVGTLVAVALLWNHLLGQGCRGVITTAVQRDPVPSLCRMPRARKVLAQISPQIEAAQAGLPGPGEAPERQTAPPLPVDPSVVPAEPGEPPPLG